MGTPFDGVQDPLILRPGRDAEARTMVRNRTVKSEPPASTPTHVGGPAPPAPVDETARAFWEFREAAVRLAERIDDLRGADPDPVAAARRELPMVRAIFGKWSSDVLVALHVVPDAGFEELRRMLPGISPRVLSEKLKELDTNGLVHREILPTRPPKVRYSLTYRGWTIAWLSHPVLLYLRTSRAEPADGPSAPSAPARTRRTGEPGARP
jgi:DNA-binding HxlR family transcriptional regulator